MITVDFAALGFALVVLIVGSIAFVVKFAIATLAADDFWELRNVPRSNPERMVADDEFFASVGRVASVGITVIIGVVWVLVSVDVFEVLVLRFVISIGVLLQALIAVAQGIRALLFRRAMAQILNRSRRPVGTHVHPEQGGADVGIQHQHRPAQ